MPSCASESDRRRAQSLGEEGGNGKGDRDGERKKKERRRRPPPLTRRDSPADVEPVVAFDPAEGHVAAVCAGHSSRLAGQGPPGQGVVSVVGPVAGADSLRRRPSFAGSHFFLFRLAARRPDKNCASPPGPWVSAPPQLPRRHTHSHGHPARQSTNERAADWGGAGLSGRLARHVAAAVSLLDRRPRIASVQSKGH
ncbi:hypothetical protein CDD83_64 [Cordyceps sp. RAO-2017]|nr:hypothetical protein CDD83_64 [Cordyceps sp. RAO-2017]